MTTFILHGGQAGKQNAQNDAFFGQLTKLVNKDSVTILLCYFSRAHDEWDSLIERNGDTIQKNSDKKVTFLVAQDPEDLLQKIDASDVLYVAGGDAEKIEPFYKDLVSLKTKLDGKVYAGSSMGMFFVTEQYVLSFGDKKARTIHKGIGLLPIQGLCHWDVEKDKERKLKLLSESSDSPILVLNEFEYVVLYICSNAIRSFFSVEIYRANTACVIVGIATPLSSASIDAHFPVPLLLASSKIE